MTTAPFTLPGVYRRDVFPDPQPLLPTGVPVFIGFADERPDLPLPLTQRLTTWPQYLETIASIRPGSLLKAAVHGFFANAGSSALCYVLMCPRSSGRSLRTALAVALEEAADITDVDLVCVPELMTLAPDNGTRQQLQQLILEQCDRTQDRFAILDTPQDVTSPEHLGAITLQGRNGAVFGPWLKSERSGQWVPPCGHVAGIIAQCDRQTGVHRAPANVAMADVLDLSLHLSDREQARLMTPPINARANCLRVFPGRGIRVWGARTVSRDHRWQYISERRLVITVGRWVALNLADVAFEPNDLSLWIRIERELRGYLASLARQGALVGSRPEDAFFVQCDATTNPSAVRDLGQVITRIGLAPAIPGEFIEVQLLHGETGVVLATTP